MTMDSHHGETRRHLGWLWPAAWAILSMLVVVACLAGCYPLSRSMRTGSVRGAAFIASYAMRAGPRMISIGEVDAYWTPEREYVDALEARLGDYLAQEAGAEHPELVAELARYRRQYVGIVVADRPLIWVNGLCEEYVRSSSADWRRQLIHVFDGGDCFWRAFYDISSEEFVGFEVNAES